ncbi:hypothetical protein PGT21_012297 [Puccinia graminis f. sp. tritici]|uniref:Uncharacterized protein n=1 Tax=Puccinia graminis f. sp. tritici TaxID=56615 RepID=A0A5B0MMS2_PUCGR|nr:hypothetical protein PGT21_012297 [Puccinia graminis f. sp. tritici]
MFWSTVVAGLVLIPSSNAVDDYYWSRVDSPPNLDDILGPIKTPGFQNSHLDIPMPTVTNTFSSSSIRGELQTPHKPTTPLPCATDHHAFSQSPHKTWFENYDDTAKILHWWEELDCHPTEISQDCNNNIPSSSLSSPSLKMAAQNQLNNYNLLSSHEIQEKRETMNCNQNFIKFPEIPEFNIFKNSESLLINASSKDNELCLLPCCFDLEAGSSHEHVATLEDHFVSAASNERKRKCSDQSNGIKRIETFSPFESFTSQHLSKPVISNSLYFETNKLNCEVPLTTLIFDSSVFGIDKPSTLDRHRIENIIEIICENDPDKPLMISVDSPQAASRNLRKLSGRGPEEKDEKQSKSKQPKQGVLKQRAALKTKSLNIFRSKIGHWSNFYKKKTNQKEFKDFNQEYKGPIGKDEIEMHLILFLFYVDMITSILVQEDQINRDKQRNQEILKEASKMYQLSSRMFIPEFTWQIGQGRCLDLVWSKVLDWFASFKHAQTFHDFFNSIHTRKYCPLFFHAVFAYSITNLSKRISEKYS